MRKIAEIYLDDILHKFVSRRVSALRSEGIELLFRFGSKVYFRAFEDRAKAGFGQAIRGAKNPLHCGLQIYGNFSAASTAQNNLEPSRRAKFGKVIQSRVCG